MKPLLLCYSKCGTCNKAAKWLKENNIDVDSRDITVENPSLAELQDWFPKSGLPINKMFNTSGVKYRELGIKDQIKSSSEQELLELLASDGKLVKRPVLVKGDTVLVGFKVEEYEQAFSISK